MRKLKKKLDIQKRINFFGFEKCVLKSIIEKYKNFVFFPIYSRKYIYENKIKNRCVFTGRARNVIRKYKLSSAQLKSLIYIGYIPGVKRSSW